MMRNTNLSKTQNQGDIKNAYIFLIIHTTKDIHTQKIQIIDRGKIFKMNIAENLLNLQLLSRALINQERNSEHHFEQLGKAMDRNFIEKEFQMIDKHIKFTCC